MSTKKNVAVIICLISLLLNDFSLLLDGNVLIGAVAEVCR